MACKYVPSEHLVMERAHAILFDRIKEELEYAMGDAQTTFKSGSSIRGSRQPNKEALCGHVYHDAKLALGPTHSLVVDAGMLMEIQFKVDVKMSLMCFHCDRMTYPSNVKCHIKRANGTNFPPECSRCSKPYIEECVHCDKITIPIFVSESGCGVPGGQLFCADCKEDHGLKRTKRRYCASCKNHVFLKRFRFFFKCVFKKKVM